jgi:putative transposase
MSETTRETMTRRRRRVMRTEEQWRELVAQFKHGNLNVREFCQQHQLTPSSFHHWRKRLSETALPGPGFVALQAPISVAPPIADSVAWDVELSLGARMTLRLRHR